MPNALIIGITGQDGVHLTEFLVARRYTVTGVTRDVRRAQANLPGNLIDEVELEAWDMYSQSAIAELIKRRQPDEVYNLAAHATGVGMYTDPVGIGEINGIAVSRILEAIRETSPDSRLCQASSAEMFGEALVSPQNETTPFNPRSPYGAAKLYAHNMVGIFRQVHSVHACSAILFNHESVRRSPDFVTRRVTSQVAKIKLGLAEDLALGNLDARRDWGYAGDFVRAMWSILQQDDADDYVIATGETHSVRDLCAAAFGHAGLNYQDYVRSDAELYRPDESVQLVGDPGKAHRQLGWKPQLSFDDMVAMMVDADIERLYSKT